MVAPGHVRWLDPRRARWLETEPSVVRGVSEQAHQRLVDCLRGAEHRVHEGRTNPGTLVFRQYPEWSERKYRMAAPDVCARAHDVPDDAVVDVQCDQG